MNLLLHPISQKRFTAIAENPPQSVLLIAPKGSGKSTILKDLALKITGDNAIGSIIEVIPTENDFSISINDIRELKRRLKSKSDTARAVLIENAGQLTIEAQNSFLKLLEEPPAKVCFLLSVSNTNDLLETIKSRTSIWLLVPPSADSIKKHFKDYPADKVEKAITIFDDRMGLISSMLTHSEDQTLIKDIESAKELLGANHLERLLKVDDLSKDRARTNELLEALILVCKAALESAARNNHDNVSRWSRRLATTLESQKLLDQNVQIKLILSKLFVVL